MLEKIKRIEKKLSFGKESEESFFDLKENSIFLTMILWYSQSYVKDKNIFAIPEYDFILDFDDDESIKDFYKILYQDMIDKQLTKNEYYKDVFMHKAFIIGERHEENIQKQKDMIFNFIQDKPDLIFCEYVLADNHSDLIPTDYYGNVLQQN